MSNPRVKAWLIGLVSTYELTTGAVANAGTPARVPIERQVEDVVLRLIGTMHSSAQAIADRNYLNIRLTTCRIRVEDAATLRPEPKATFLYQEQAASLNLAKPYRQRFLRISSSTDGRSVQSAVFKPSAPKALVGLCNMPEQNRVVNLSTLGMTDCSVFLQRCGENYVGSTPVGGCPNQFRGAVRVTSKVVLHRDGLDSWDRGFDAAGKQVWGTEAGPYQFRHIDPTLNRGN